MRKNVEKYECYKNVEIKTFYNMLCPDANDNFHSIINNSKSEIKCDICELLPIYAKVAEHNCKKKKTYKGILLEIERNILNFINLIKVDKTKSLIIIQQHNLRQNIVEILNKHNVNIQYPEYKTTPHYQSSTNVDYIDTELKEAYEKLLKNKTIAQYFIP